ncbi:MAG TPA: hypothetical protein P5279_09555 [Anaerohalosphaeraceae bacterium]|nr:hypothetical protein [Anaerohalosphaeraceae bacterium]HRT50727.1 hypothetical protein [Anaerohalosphaeraceae bacterium]HRT86921.1 hypothetical protein [Anaerohalosphaeraceae bacterium]
MKVGVDLDATITAYPEFFSAFTAAMAAAGHEIHVITNRPPGTVDWIAGELEGYGITWHAIHITRDKAAYIMAEGISALFDDMDEYFATLPEEVAVFKVRQHYNFDFVEHKWLCPARTTRLVEKIG